MEEKDLVEVLQYYRHDLMNNLQVINGYLSMGKLGKVEKKFEELFANFEEERKLLSLKTPKFILWLINFNHIYDNFRVDYNIHTENAQLHKIDDILIIQSKRVMDFCKKISELSTLYEVKLDLIVKDHSQIEVSFSFNGNFNIENSFIINEENKNEIHVDKKTNGIVCHFFIPIEG